MTVNNVASMIAKAEGKKHQASIGDIREILKILIDLQAEIPGEPGMRGSSPLGVLLLLAMAKMEKESAKALKKSLKKNPKKKK